MKKWEVRDRERLKSQQLPKKVNRKAGFDEEANKSQLGKLIRYLKYGTEWLSATECDR